MKGFRLLIVRYVFLLITGVSFLNMSFFIGEIALLNLSKDDASIEFVIKILLAGGFEEESETADEHEKAYKEVDLYFGSNLCHHQQLFQIAQQRFGSLNILIPRSGHSQIFSPPPEA